MITSYLANAATCESPSVVSLCSFPNSIRTMETGLSPTCHGIFSNYLDMSRWFETPELPRNMIHVRNFPVTSRQLPWNFLCLPNIPAQKLPTITKHKREWNAICLLLWLVLINLWHRSKPVLVYSSLTTMLNLMLFGCVKACVPKPVLYVFYCTACPGCPLYCYVYNSKFLILLLTLM